MKEVHGLQVLSILVLEIDILIQNPQDIPYLENPNVFSLRWFIYFKIK
jgi:hypothetical protein